MSESSNVMILGWIITQISKENVALLSSFTPSWTALDILSVCKISNRSFAII